MNLKALLSACGKLSRELITDASHHLCLGEGGVAVLLGETNKVKNLEFHVSKSLFDEMTNGKLDGASLPSQEKGVKIVHYRGYKFYLATDKTIAGRKIFVSGKHQVSYVV